MRLALSILLCCALGAKGATYYIDFASGNNSNAGTSTGAPWKHSPGDTNATSTAASVTLVAGDVVKFKGGVTYQGFVVLTNGGSSASPLIFDGNFANDWGTGRAVWDGMYHTNGTLLGAVVSISNLVVRGFTFQNAGGYDDTHPFVVTNQSPQISASTGGVGVMMWGGSRYENIVVHDCFFNKIGNWRNHASFTSDAITGFGVAFRYVFGGMVSNCVVMRTHTGIGIYSCRDVTVHGNDISTNIVWGVDVAPQQTTDIISNITVSANAIHDYPQFVEGNWLGGGDPPHTDGIFVRDSAITATWYPVKVHGNRFWCDYPESSLGGTASIFISQGPSVWIYNNVVNSDSHTRMVSVEYQATTDNDQFVLIANNTILSSSTDLLFADETNDVRRVMYVWNNILLKTPGVAANNPMITALSGDLPNRLDYNLFYDPDTVAASKYTHVIPAYTLWDNRMAWYQVDTNSVYSNPLLVDRTNSVPSLRNFRPMAGSPALNLGTNLTSYFTTDILGASRPSSGAWTAGAYQETNSPSSGGSSITKAVMQGKMVFQGKVVVQ